MLLAAAAIGCKGRDCKESVGGWGPGGPGQGCARGDEAVCCGFGCQADDVD